MMHLLLHPHHIMMLVGDFSSKTCRSVFSTAAGIAVALNNPRLSIQCRPHSVMSLRLCACVRWSVRMCECVGVGGECAGVREWGWVRACAWARLCGPLCVAACVFRG